MLPKLKKVVNFKYHADLIRDYSLIQDALLLVNKHNMSDLAGVGEQIAILTKAATEFEKEFANWDSNQTIFAVELPEDYFNKTCTTAKDAIENLKTKSAQFKESYEPVKNMRYQAHEFLFYGTQFNKNFNKFIL